MPYDVRLTPQATAHIDEIERCIAWNLGEPRAANRWKLSLLDEPAKLKTMPARHPVFERES